MGTVHLTQSHHGLYVRNRDVDIESRVLLDTELLARPIYSLDKVFTAPSQYVIRAALQGLMDLRGFNAAVSYRVHAVEGVSHIALPGKRVWGEITLSSPEDVVVGFSHDSRHNNDPFYNIMQWLEEDYPDGTLDAAGYQAFCERWSSADAWRSFFEAKIRRKIESLRNDAGRLRREAGAIDTRIDSIKEALG